MNFATLKGLTIPEGNVTQIADASGRVLWKSAPAGGVVTEAGEILDTWDAISSGNFISSYSLGNWKSFLLSDGTEVVMEVVALNADTKTDGSTAGVTWISRDIITKHVINSTASNENGWAASEMRSWLRGDFYATLPAEVRNAIASVNKTYYDYTTKSTKSIDDNVWLPSAREIFGNTEGSGVSYTTYFNGPTIRVKKYSGTVTAWWLRSADSNGKDSWLSVPTHGYVVGYVKPTASNGVVLGFCT